MNHSQAESPSGGVLLPSAACGKMLVTQSGEAHVHNLGDSPSGNIRIAHNDQYLCIVPDRSMSAKENLFLSFEGDSTLSIIISKAFLLANDTAIKDPSITRQLA